MMPAGYLRGLRAMLEGGGGVTNLPAVDDDDAGPVDDGPYTALEVIAVLSPTSVPPGAWAITGMDAVGRNDWRR